MPKCIVPNLSFGRIGWRMIEADFSGGALSSDGGLMLLRQVDRSTGLSRMAADVLHDPRDPDRITHSLGRLVAQRLYGLCCGYEDLNDHDALRTDPLMQAAVGTDAPLGSSPTLCRLETRVRRADIMALNQVLVDQFIASHGKKASEELVLDVDASDIPLHGTRSRCSSTRTTIDTAIYHCTYLRARRCVPRRSRIDGARHASAVIKLLITWLR